MFVPGLVWSYAFDGEGEGRACPPTAVPPLREDGDGFVWLHFDLVDQRVSSWCGAQETLPDKAREVFLSTDTHLRLDHADGRVWGLFADLSQEFDHESHAPTRLYFVMAGRWLITGRRHPASGALQTRERIEEGERFSSPCRLLEAMVEGVLDRVDGLSRELERKLDDVEDRVVVRGSDDDDRRLAPIRHELVRQSRQLSKSCTVLHRFADWAEGADLPQDTQAAMERLLQRIEALRHDFGAMQERARLLQEEATDNRGAEMNRHLYVLTILTSVLMPATLVASFFGMNTAGLPFAGTPLGTLVAFVLGLVSSAGVFWIFYRMRRQR